MHRGALRLDAGLNATTTFRHFLRTAPGRPSDGLHARALNHRPASLCHAPRPTLPFAAFAALFAVNDSTLGGKRQVFFQNLTVK